jgi:hypothetical protein
MQIENTQVSEKVVISYQSESNLMLFRTCVFLPYVLNGPIHLFLLGILLMDPEVKILYENNMLQDLLQICKFIEDIIM